MCWCDVFITSSSLLHSFWQHFCCCYKIHQYYGMHPSLIDWYCRPCRYLCYQSTFWHTSENTISPCLGLIIYSATHNLEGNPISLFHENGKTKTTQSTKAFLKAIFHCYFLLLMSHYIPALLSYSNSFLFVAVLFDCKLQEANNDSAGLLLILWSFISSFVHTPAMLVYTFILAYCWVYYICWRNDLNLWVHSCTIVNFFSVECIFVFRNAASDL